MTGDRPAENSQTRHATTVAIGNAGVMITGPSGSGKSALAIQLIAFGAALVADDRTRLELREGWPWALAPDRLSGVIEARGVGLVTVPSRAAVPLRLVVDMGAAETSRLPENRVEKVLGAEVALIRRVDGPHFPAAIVALAQGGLRNDG